MTAPLAFVADFFTIAGDPDRQRFTTEPQAVAHAEGRVGPRSVLVTIEAHVIDQAGTFAVRHFRWAGGEVTDSGWRCWVDGEFWPVEEVAA